MQELAQLTFAEATDGNVRAFGRSIGWVPFFPDLERDGMIYTYLIERRSKSGHRFSVHPDGQVMVSGCAFKPLERLGDLATFAEELVTTKAFGYGWDEDQTPKVQVAPPLLPRYPHIVQSVKAYVEGIKR